ncbi:MAG: ROK family protein [Dermatophilaceae bacterium]
MGIDIGGTKTAALVLDDDGVVAAHVASPSGRGRTQTLATAADVAHRAAGVVGGWSGITAVGACMPGLVDRATGWARHAVNLEVHALDLAGGLEAATGFRPRIDNDVKAAALGAHHVVRPDATIGTTAYLGAGTGLAAAIVSDGVVVRGADGAAGEIGHLPVGTGVACRCGQTGCLETIASGTALHRLWRRPPDRLFPAAAAGDREAQEVVAVLAHGIALAVQLLVVAGAELVIVGGGLARDRDELRDAVLADVAARASGSPFLARLGLPARMRVLDGETPVAAIGAALLNGVADPVDAAGVG